MTQGAFLTLCNVTKSFGNQRVIDNLSLSLDEGQMATLLGPSGCGKTTILRLIAGLETPDSGQILMNGQDITHRPIQQREIGIVFQSYALFPHLSVAENIGYGLKMQGVSPHERQQLVQDALALVELNGFEDRRIEQLSGGQQQRVALARALILKPKILLFDEPLSNLDANLRREMREKIRDLQQRLHITALYVTHDQSEAFAVSDQVVVMERGVIKQQGSAQALYRKPNSRFLAQFMGESTLLPAVRNGNEIWLNDFCVQLPNAAEFAVADGNCLLGIRPEAVRLSRDGLPAQQALVQKAVYMGAYWEIALQWQGSLLLANLNAADYTPNQAAYYVSLLPSGLFLLAE